MIWQLATSNGPSISRKIEYILTKLGSRKAIKILPIFKIMFGVTKCFKTCVHHMFIFYILFFMSTDI